MVRIDLWLLMLSVAILSLNLAAQEVQSNDQAATSATDTEIAATGTGGFDKRLAKLDGLLEAARIRHKIPGVAFALVRDDQVIFAKGYGDRDVKQKKPVETDTIFAIGSTTKAFTSSVIAMLVDDGKMEWDDPVTRFLPEFRLNLDTGKDEVTVRDLLCHRTGFTRMGLLWAGGTLTREEIITRIADAEPYAKFREKFHYNNVMYMAAGLCAGEAAESDWDSLIAERIFKPLGMQDSSTTIRVAQKDSRLALGYKWDKDIQAFAHLPMRNLDSVGPAGSINSNVNDMAQWLRFQLSRGKFNNHELITQRHHAETWNKQINMAGRVDYGFGWMLRQWNQQAVIEHVESCAMSADKTRTPPQSEIRG